MVKATALLLQHVSVFDSENKRFRDDQDILITDTIIAKISQGEPDQPPKQAIYDCRGLYALPGLWECHGHLAALTAEKY
ncbi:hypothetical protein ACFL27_27485 [candidate division CSSED10-310 bacterium]|uniref:Amidohydrolase n=1 Tax=candidate division CSSED10-310 bacterium TaxID=2855610 RepID=A0ABV6Z675_UNCC1